MTRDDQARQRLVEIARECVAPTSLSLSGSTMRNLLADPSEVRRRAGFKNPSKGSWCAAGVAAAMDLAGLLVPAPGTSARRGAVALLDFVAEHGLEVVERRTDGSWAACKGAKPGDQPGPLSRQEAGTVAEGADKLAGIVLA